MKHPPPWWLRLPIYLDWIQASLFILFPLTFLAAGSRLVPPGLAFLVSGAAALLITADTLCGLGHRWVLLPRVGLGFLAISWIVRTLSGQVPPFVHWVLIGVAIQQLWLLLACLAAEIRLRNRSKLTGP